MPKSIIFDLRVYINKNPLTFLLFVALFIRLLAAFFSKGYAFHDDHFCVIRVAQSWSEGIPHWLQSENPPKHSMLYAGINALFMWIMGKSGITDPIIKTTLLRIIHAFYSLLTVYFAYKITLLLSNKKNALLVGWILALLWFMPYLSVKFLAELVCVPPVLAGFYLILKALGPGKKIQINFLLAGMLFALAFAVRMHTILFAGGLGMVLLFQKQWLQSLMFTSGYLIAVIILIGIPDVLFFEYPFQYVVNYFVYNRETAYDMVTGSPLKFTLTTLGFLVPPISIFLIWGYIKSLKIEPKLFVAILIFFVFHSAFPHQQERFILPMFPLLIMMGVIGWNEFAGKSRFWLRNQWLHKGLWNFFWTVNVIAAIALALTFTKKDRIEPLYYLSKKEGVTSIIVESEGPVKQVPVYYFGQTCVDYHEFQGDLLGLKEIKANQGYLKPSFVMVFNLGSEKSTGELRAEMDNVHKQPNYVVFKGENNFNYRKKRIAALFPGKKLIFEKEIHPSNFDKLLHFLNPRVHRNNVALIYKIV